MKFELDLENVSGFGAEFDPVFEACAQLLMIERHGVELDYEVLEELADTTVSNDFAEMCACVSKEKTRITLRNRHLTHTLDPQHRGLPRLERNARSRERRIKRMKEIYAEVIRG